MSRIVLAGVLAITACDRGDERTGEPVAIPHVRAPQPVKLDAVVVAVGRSVLWVQHAGDARALVVPRDPAMLVGLRVGQRIDVDGELRPTPAAAELAELGVAAHERAAAAAEPVYIHAVRIATAGAAYPRS